MTNFFSEIVELFFLCCLIQNKQNKEGKDNHVCKYLQIKQNKTPFQQNDSAFCPTETAS